MSEAFNPPAFPTTKPLDGWGDPNQGMTLRDYFAGQALVGHLAEGGWRCDDSHFQEVAKGAYRFADAMLKERAK